MDYIFVKSIKPGKEEFGSVYARIRTNGINKKYAIGFIIKEHEWLKYRSLQYTSSAIMTSIGIKFGQFSSILAQIKSALEDNFEPTKATAIIRSIKANVLNGEKLDVKMPIAKGKVSLIKYLEEYIISIETGTRLKKGKGTKISDGQVANIKALKTSLMNYERERRRTLSLDDITMDFRNDFIKWCDGKELSHNTIVSKLSQIRTVMIAAYESQKTQNAAFRHSEFVPVPKQVDHVYLNPTQIQEMLDMDLSSRESIAAYIEKADYPAMRKQGMQSRLSPKRCMVLEQARDIFIIGCLTGQRVSDYKRIDSSKVKEINGIRFVQIVQKKTGKNVFIPMDRRVKALIDKYDGELPDVNYKKIIDIVKLLGEWLHWTYKADIDESRLGSKKSSRFCDLLGTHTARRSFATNAYAANVPLSSIMAVTGHSTEQMLRRYLKLEDKEKAIIAAKDFKGILQTDEK